MEENGYPASFNPYPTANDISSQEESRGEHDNPVDGFLAGVFSETNDDDLYSSHYTLSSAYPRSIDISSSAESLAINHGLMASYEPVPAPSNPFNVDIPVGRAPSSIGDSSNDEPINTPGTDGGSMVASPVEMCAESPLPHSASRRDDPESDNSCTESLRVNTGRYGVMFLLLTPKGC